MGLQPGSLFQPQGNKTVHLYDWKEGKVHQIFDAGIAATLPLDEAHMKSFPLQVVVVSQFLSTQLSLHVDGKEIFLTLFFTRPLSCCSH